MNTKTRQLLYKGRQACYDKFMSTRKFTNTKTGQSKWTSTSTLHI